MALKICQNYHSQMCYQDDGDCPACVIIRDRDEMIRAQEESETYLKDMVKELRSQIAAIL